MIDNSIVNTLGTNQKYFSEIILTKIGIMQIYSWIINKTYIVKINILKPFAHKDEVNLI